MSAEKKENNSKSFNILSKSEVNIGDSIPLDIMSQVFAKLHKDFVWFSSLTEQINFCSTNINMVLGYESEEIKSYNEKRLALIKNENVPHVREALNEFLVDSNLKYLQLNYDVECKNKSVIHVFEKIYADRDEKGEIINLYGIVSDITPLQESKEDLFATISDLQNLNEAKDKFVSRISHDLRSPFTSIIGFAEVLINDPEIPEKERTEYLNFILQSSKNLLQFVNQLNEIIKLQTHRTKLDPQRANVNKLIHYAIASFTSQVVSKGLEIKVDVHESVHINADERLFLVLITGLISNAVKFSRAGGKITITARDFNDDFIEIVTKDEGVGISEKNKIKLFKIDQIFFSEGTNKEKGVGLGLLLAKEIVEKHGGNLWFYSTQNEGVEFHFTIPVSKNSILIVEKDLSLKNGYEDIIKNGFPQYEIKSARDGYEALNLVSSVLPSIIVLNHDLPLMTGWQFLDTLFKTYKHTKFSTVVIVDENSEELNSMYKQIGVTELLLKPVSFKVLQRKISEFALTFR